MEPELVGIVQTDISNLFFEEPSRPTGYDQSIAQYLAKIFDKVGCDRYDSRNFIPGFISPSQREELLGDPLVRKRLRDSLTTHSYPKVQFHEKIQCVHGYHRWKAAETLDSSDKWWTVILYFPRSEDERLRFTRKEREQYHHQVKYNSGDIYHNVRHYMGTDETEFTDKWKIRLSDCGQICLSQLLRRREYVQGFDMLRSFPGILEGLEFGNVQKHFAIHWDKGILHNIEHIYVVWNGITLGNYDVQRATDIRTVKELQARAPSASSVDREAIACGMDNEFLFSAVTNADLRQSIKEALLKLDVMIPTIKTLHMNVSYFQIGAKILRAQLFPEAPKKDLYETMRDNWSPPEIFQVEIREGEFKYVDAPREDQAYIAYTQVWLFVLRHFPSLSNCEPRLDKRKRHSDDDARGFVDYARVLQLQKLAFRVGFRSDKIIHGNNQTLTSQPHDWRSASTLNVDGEDIDRRYGRPFSSAFMHIEKHLFLSNLSSILEVDSIKPSVLFVQNDIIKGFFGSRFSNILRRYGRLISESITLPNCNEEPASTQTEPREELRPRERGVSQLQETLPREVSQLPKEVPQPRETNKMREEPDRRKPQTHGPELRGKSHRTSIHSRPSGDHIPPILPSADTYIGSSSRGSHRSSTFGREQSTSLNSPFMFRITERHSMGERIPPMKLHNIHNIETYLRAREGWVMTTFNYGVFKTIRREHICEYMVNNPQEKYVIVSPDYIERFIQNQFRT